jgi:GNAT superfamily N-acetyltransferase
VPDTALALDLICARAWPPVEELAMDGWRLRFSGGVTKRANSVLPCPPADPSSPSATDLEECISLIEAAYADRGLPARFQVTASSWPGGLADALRRRGYAEADRTLVMTRGAADYPSLAAGPAGVAVSERDEPSPEWMETWWSVDGRGGDPELAVAKEILGRIEPARHFIAVQVGGATASVGLAVIDSGWVGVYCMATLPDFRRGGLASQVLNRALELGAQHGANRAYLAVTEGNKAALWLYAKAGFEARLAYSYFTKPG